MGVIQEMEIFLATKKNVLQQLLQPKKYHNMLPKLTRHAKRPTVQYSITPARQWNLLHSHEIGVVRTVVSTIQ